MLKPTRARARSTVNNEINYEALEATVEEMVPVGKQRIQREHKPRQLKRT